MVDYMPLLKAIETALAKADADLEAFLEEQGYPNPSGLVEAIESVQDVLEELLDDYLERIAEALIDCKDQFELLDEWNKAKEDAELKRAASDAVAETLFSYALPFLDEYIKNDDAELDASELSLKAIGEILTLADQMTDGKIDALNDRIEAGLRDYKEPEDSEADKAEKSAPVEKGVLDDLKSKLRGLGSKIKSFGQRAIESVFGSSKLDRARDCRSTATQTVLMYESVVQQEAIVQNPVVERKIWRHNHSENPRENHVAMDGVIADADGFFELTGRDGNVYRIEGPRASSLPPSESYNCHCTVETVTNAEILNSDVETKSSLQDEAVANVNAAFQSSADKELYERAMEWNGKFADGTIQNLARTGGSTGTSSGSKKSVMTAKEQKQLEGIAAKMGVNADYTGFNADLAKAVNQSIADVQNMFGTLSELKGVESYTSTGNSYARFNRRTGTILLKNVGDSDIMTKMQTAAKEEYQHGGWSTGDACHSIVHEIGHALAEEALNSTNDPNGVKRAALEKLRRAEVKRITGDENTDIVAEFKSKNPNIARWCALAKSNLSLYGISSVDEMIAESLAQNILGTPGSIAQQTIFTLS